MIVQTIESKCYGTYYLECIGIFSPRSLINYFPDGEEGINLIQKWMEEYHPKDFFRSFGIIKLGDEKDQFSDVAYSVASEGINSEWKKNNPHISSKSKKLPIAISENKILKWKASLPPEIITPEYFLNSSSIEELKKNWSLANNNL